MAESDVLGKTSNVLKTLQVVLLTADLSRGTLVLTDKGL